MFTCKLTQTDGENVRAITMSFDMSKDQNDWHSQRAELFQAAKGQGFEAGFVDLEVTFDVFSWSDRLIML